MPMVAPGAPRPPDYRTTGEPAVPCVSGCCPAGTRLSGDARVGGAEELEGTPPQVGLYSFRRCSSRSGAGYRHRGHRSTPRHEPCTCLTPAESTRSVGDTAQRFPCVWNRQHQTSLAMTLASNKHQGSRFWVRQA